MITNTQKYIDLRDKLLELHYRAIITEFIARHDEVVQIILIGVKKLLLNAAEYLRNNNLNVLLVQALDDVDCTLNKLNERTAYYSYLKRTEGV